MRDARSWDERQRRVSIRGYDAFDVYEADDEGLPDYDAGVAIRPFLRQLAEYLAPDAELGIQTAGYTECWFPARTQRYVVHENEVLHADLGSLDPIDDSGRFTASQPSEYGYVEPWAEKR